MVQLLSGPSLCQALLQVPGMHEGLSSLFSNLTLAQCVPCLPAYLPVAGLSSLYSQTAHTQLAPCIHAPARLSTPQHQLTSGLPIRAYHPPACLPPAACSDLLAPLGSLPPLKQCLVVDSWCIAFLGLGLPLLLLYGFETRARQEFYARHPSRQLRPPWAALIRWPPGRLQPTWLNTAAALYVASCLAWVLASALVVYIPTAWHWLWRL